MLQKNEVTSSNAMEKEGLSRCLHHLKESNIRVESLTTDRHPSVKKYLHDVWPQIKHWFDRWHMTKGTVYLISFVPEKIV